MNALLKSRIHCLGTRPHERMIKISQVCQSMLGVEFESKGLVAALMPLSVKWSTMQCFHACFRADRCDTAKRLEVEIPDVLRSQRDSYLPSSNVSS